ncbi:MAG: YfbM family protein [Bacillota bacterium]|nr:YfbM family protein [Bacillota bacterium]
MGLIGQYMMINNQTFKSLVDLENDDLIEMIEDLSEDEKNEIYDIDKLWDGLHFFLTGISACQPIEGNKLSEAIVGVKVFNNDEDADFIAYTMSEYLHEIVTALSNVDIEKLRLNFGLSKFRKAKIYPDIWRDKDKESLFDELMQEYKKILNFYTKALERKAHVIVSIY